MIEKKLSLVISFNKTTDANGVGGRLIPLPKEISAGCGLAWKCELDKKDEITKVLAALNIKCDKMVELVI